jgi:hypothetical protein
MKILKKVLLPFLIFGFLFVLYEEYSDYMLRERINTIFLDVVDLNFEEMDIQSFHSHGKYWYKFHVSQIWFKRQIPKLQKAGYSIFKNDERDLPADVFTKESELYKSYWYSSYKLPGERYSIYYNEEDTLLILILFFH